jgi:hypothetical protein
MAKKGSNLAQLKARKQQAAKAAAQYNEVVIQPTDLKSLVAAVAKAAEVKKATKRKAVAKTKVDKALAKAVAAEATKLNAQAKDAEDKAAALTEQAQQDSAPVEKADTPVSEPPETPVVSLTAALAALDNFREQLNAVADSPSLTKDMLRPCVEAASVASDEIAKIPARESRSALLGEFLELYKRLSVLKSRTTARARLLASVKGAAGKVKEAPGALKKGIALAGRKAKGIKDAVASSVQQLAGSTTSALSVKSVARVGEGLKVIGKSIKENGLDTLKWVGGKLSDLNSRVMGLFRSAKNFMTGGDASDWLAIGAIGMGILPTLIDGMVEELKKRFGDNFVMGFINEKWDATKKFVTEWLEDFIGKAVSAIKDLPDTLKKIGSEAWQGTKNAASNTAHVLKEMVTPDTPERKAAKERVAIKAQGGVPPLRQFVNLIDEYDAATSQPRKDEIADRIVQLVNATPSLKNEPRVLANMKSRNINVSAKVVNATNTSTSTANANVAPSTARASSTSVSAPVSNTNVSVSPPPATAKEEPVVAEKPAAPPASSGGSSDAGAATGTLSGGLNNASVPNNAADETLTFMNVASMGAA